MRGEDKTISGEIYYVNVREAENAAFPIYGNLQGTRKDKKGQCTSVPEQKMKIM